MISQISTLSFQIPTWLFILMADGRFASHWLPSLIVGVKSSLNGNLIHLHTACYDVGFFLAALR